MIIVNNYASGVTFNEDLLRRLIEIKAENPRLPKRGFKKWYNELKRVKR